MLINAFRTAKGEKSPPIYIQMGKFLFTKGRKTVLGAVSIVTVAFHLSQITM